MVNFFKLDNQELKVYIGNIFFIIFTNIILVSSLIFIFLIPLSNFLQFPKLWLFISILVALEQVIISIVLVLWQANQKPLSYGLFNIFNMLTDISVSLLFIVMLGWGWQGRLLGMGFALSIFSIIGIFILFKKKKLHFSIRKAYIKDILIFGIPLIPHALGGWIITGINRIFINSMVSFAATGIYVIGYQVGMIISILSISFNTAFSPFLFKKLEENNYATKIKIVKYTYIYSISLIALALLLGFTAPTLLSFLVDKNFYGASEYVIWISMGFAFEGLYLVVGNYIFYAKNTYLLSLVTFSSALLNIGLNYILIKHNGVLGAAQATFLTYLIFCLSTWYLSSRVYEMPWYQGLIDLLKGRIF